jgi:hypothetical protein
MILEATCADLPALTDLYFEFFSVGVLDDTGLTLDNESVQCFILDVMANKNGAVFVYKADGKIIGSVAGVVEPWNSNRNLLILHELWWFVPGRSRKEHPYAAIRLFNKLVAHGKALGATTICVSSSDTPETEKVKGLYKRIGLKVKDVNYIGRM